MNTKFPTVSPSTIGREEKNFFFISSSLQIEWYWKKNISFYFQQTEQDLKIQNTQIFFL